MDLNKSMEQLLENNTVEEVLDILEEKEGDAKYVEEKEECDDIVKELDGINDELKSSIEAEDKAQLKVDELRTSIKDKLGNLKVRFPEVYTRDFVDNENFKGLAKSRINWRKKADKTALKAELIAFLSKHGASTIREIEENVDASLSSAYGLLRGDLSSVIDSSEKDGNSILYRYIGATEAEMQIENLEEYEENTEHSPGIEDLNDNDFNPEEGDEYFGDVEAETEEFKEEE